VETHVYSTGITWPQSPVANITTGALHGPLNINHIQTSIATSSWCTSQLITTSINSSRHFYRVVGEFGG
jgi:hypothetical protein